MNSVSLQKLVINRQSEAIAHWPTPHEPFVKAEKIEQGIIDQFKLYWEDKDRAVVNALAVKLSAILGTKYVVRNVEVDWDTIRRYSYYY